MKARKWMTLVGLAMVVALVALPAMAQTVKLRADIPFAFTANSMPMAAGECTIQSVANWAIVLRDAEHNSVMALLKIDDTRDASDAKLVFHRYGDQYFLARIETPDASYKVPLSLGERKLARSSSPQEVAVVVSGLGEAGL